MGVVGVSQMRPDGGHKHQTARRGQQKTAKQKSKVQRPENGASPAHVAMVELAPNKKALKGTPSTRVSEATTGLLSNMALPTCHSPTHVSLAHSVISEKQGQVMKCSVLYTGIIYTIYTGIIYTTKGAIAPNCAHLLPIAQAWSPFTCNRVP